MQSGPFSRVYSSFPVPFVWIPHCIFFCFTPLHSIKFHVLLPSFPILFSYLCVFIRPLVPGKLKNMIVFLWFGGADPLKKARWDVLWQLQNKTSVHQPSLSCPALRWTRLTRPGRAPSGPVQRGRAVWARRAVGSSGSRLARLLQLRRVCLPTFPSHPRLPPGSRPAARQLWW